MADNSHLVTGRTTAMGIAGLKAAQPKALFVKHQQAHLSIRLPLPPTINNYRRALVVGGVARLVSTKAGRQYHKDVAVIVARTWPIWEPLTGRIRIRIVCSMARRGEADLDNRLKAVLDAITAAGVLRDDSQVDDLQIVRGPVEAPGHVDVMIETIQ